MDCHGREHNLYGGSHGVWVEFLNAASLGQGSWHSESPLSGRGLPERTPWGGASLQGPVGQLAWLENVSVHGSGLVLVGECSPGEPALLLSPELSFTI